MLRSRTFWLGGDERLRRDTGPIVAFIIGAGGLAAAGAAQAVSAGTGLRDAVPLFKRRYRLRIAIPAIALAAIAGAGIAAEPAATNVSTPTETPVDGLTRETLTGDWGESRTRLKERGITIAPRLTQFYQGLSAGEGDHGYKYGGKADVLFNADLRKLGLWDGLSMTVHAEYNFGKSVNGRGGVLIPVNTALNTPGMEGGDAFDFSSIYFGQNFGDVASVVFGKINMIDMVAPKAFMGGAGIDAFWNQTFVATPTGTVPPYLFGALMSVFTEQATYRLWVYDPNSAVNKTITDAFDGGVSIRASVEFPMTIGGRPGHQGFTAFWGNQSGTDLQTLDDIFLPSPTPGTVAFKDSRYYVAYSFDQTLVQATDRPGEAFGLFGQFGISDGNPNGLYWSFLIGIGGKGLIAGRTQYNWGAGYYYDRFSKHLKDALAPAVSLRDEQGFEAFYNVALTPWFVIGADLQVIKPGLANTTAVVPGLRAVMRF